MPQPFTRSIALALAVPALLAGPAVARADTHDGAVAGGPSACEEFRAVVQADAFDPRVDDLARRCQELTGPHVEGSDDVTDIAGDRESVIDAWTRGPSSSPAPPSRSTNRDPRAFTYDSGSTAGKWW